MVTTRLSSKGQVIIPKAIRQGHHWAIGQELVVIDTGDAIILRAAAPFKATTLQDVGGCLNFNGPTRSLQDMEKAIKRGAADTGKAK